MKHFRKMTIDDALARTHSITDMTIGEQAGLTLRARAEYIHHLMQVSDNKTYRAVGDSMSRVFVNINNIWYLMSGTVSDDQSTPEGSAIKWIYLHEAISHHKQIRDITDWDAIEQQVGIIPFIQSEDQWVQFINNIPFDKQLEMLSINKEAINLFLTPSGKLKRYHAMKWKI